MLRQYVQDGGTLFLEATRKDPELKALVHYLTGNAGIKALASEHHLKRQPFRFGQLPTTASGELEIFCGSGVILAVFPLSDAWNSDVLMRHDIRAAQELGINVLHFAWQRRYYHHLLT
jgi:hypothetical protein